MSLKANEFDVIVIGSGLSGLITATVLAESKKVALIEMSETPGGRCRTGLFSTVPNTESNEKALGIIEKITGQSIRRKLIQENPVTFDDGFRPFVGFGENSPEFVDEVSYYTSQDRYLLEDAPEQWTQWLFSQFKGQFFNLSEVTKISVDQFNIYSVLINGQKTLVAGTVIFTGNPKSMLQLLPADQVGAKLRQKIVKAPLWSSLLLQVHHKEPVTETQAVHVLHAKSEENHPCLGRFIDSQTSHWISFLSEAESQDEEYVGQLIKKMKKQISRVYPSALIEPRSEKISLFPASHGAVLRGADESPEVPGFKNLFLVGASIGEDKNISNAVLQAERCLQQLGCHHA